MILDAHAARKPFGELLSACRSEDVPYLVSDRLLLLDSIGEKERGVPQRARRKRKERSSTSARAPKEHHQIALMSRAYASGSQMKQQIDETVITPRDFFADLGVSEKELEIDVSRHALDGDGRMPKEQLEARLRREGDQDGLNLRKERKRIEENAALERGHPKRVILLLCSPLKVVCGTRSTDASNGPEDTRIGQIAALAMTHQRGERDLTESEEGFFGGLSCLDAIESVNERLNGSGASLLSEQLGEYLARSKARMGIGTGEGA